MDELQGQRFDLPAPYRDIKAALTSLLNTFVDLYLHDVGPCVPDKDNVIACPDEPEGDILCRHRHYMNFILLGYLARAFYDGWWITQMDCNSATLSDDLRLAVLTIADHVIAYANADTEGIVVTDPVHGNKVPTLGWTNHAGRWDAFWVEDGTNNTCSPVGRPNIWASAWALNTLALAYRVSSTPAAQHYYSRAFRLGAAYWNASATSSVFEALSGADQTILLANLAPGKPRKVRKLYTVGGSSFDAVADEPVIRYHYFSDDPVRFALNEEGLFGLVMISMGLATPDAAFQIADPDNADSSAYRSRSYASIGRATMQSVYGNLKAGNVGYYDQEDMAWTIADNEVDGYTGWTAYYLAHAGTVLGEDNYVSVARQLLLDVVDEAGALSDSNRLHFGCLNRALDQQLMSLCQSELVGKNLTDPTKLVAAIVQLSR